MFRALALLAAITCLQTLGTSPAFARDCSNWDASMQELEEGRALVASICSNDDGGRSFLEARCSPPGLNIRYVPRDDGDYSNFQGDLIFQTEEYQRLVFVAYEGLDGAFAAYLPFGHPAVEMMKSGKSITVSAEGGRVPARAFELGGSRRALERLKKSCQR